MAPDIDIILRTYNRAELLPGAIESFFAADSRGIEPRLIVVDNGSTDDTQAILARVRPKVGGRLTSLIEHKGGGQHALNAGIAIAQAPIIAFFDDDERIAVDWLQVIKREMADLRTGYIAGPCQPIWSDPIPEWLPQHFGGVLGIIDSGPAKRRFGDPEFGGMLTQGNCAVRLSLLRKIGPYPPELKTAEDVWLGNKLAALGAEGYYCPTLVIHHVIQRERLERQYFRNWARREGRDRAVNEKLAGKPTNITAPWFWRKFFENSAAHGFSFASRNGSPAQQFKHELEMRQAFSYILTSAGLRQ